MNWGGFRISTRTLAGLVAVAALAMPAQAGAASVTMAGDTLGIVSGPEASKLTVSREGSSIVVGDSTGPVSAGSGCSKTGGKRAKCPATDVGQTVAVLGGGDDSIDATATGPVAIWGGSGDDTLLVQNSYAESISCGPGTDSGTADANDLLATDCEGTLARPTVAAPTIASPPPAEEPAVTGTGDGDATGEESGGEPGGGDSSALGDDREAGDAGDPAPDAAPVRIETPKTVGMTPRGDIAIGVTCTAAAGACAGSIELFEEGGAVKARAQVNSARRRKASRKARLLGRAKFSVEAGAAKQVRVRLSRRGRQRIIKRKKRKTRAKIVITVMAPDGTVSKTEKSVSIAVTKERRTSSRRRSGKKHAIRKGRRG